MKELFISFVWPAFAHSTLFSLMPHTQKKKGEGGRSTRFSKPSWWKSRCSSTGSARFPLQLAKQSLPHQRKLIVRESVGGGSSVREKTRPWWDFIITTTTVFLRKTKDCKIKNRQLSIVYSIKIGKKKKAGLPVFLFFWSGVGKKKRILCCLVLLCCKRKRILYGRATFPDRFCPFSASLYQLGSVHVKYVQRTRRFLFHPFSGSFFLYFSQVTCILFPLRWWRKISSNMLYSCRAVWHQASGGREPASSHTEAESAAGSCRTPSEAIKS